MDPVFNTVPAHGAAPGAIPPGVATRPAAAGATRPLWVAVGVLGLAVVALGATLVAQHTGRDAAAPPAQAVASLTDTAPVGAAGGPVAGSPVVTAPATAPPAGSAAFQAPKPSLAQAQPTQDAPRTVAKTPVAPYPPAPAIAALPPVTAPVGGAAPQGAGRMVATAGLPEAPPVCGHCGRVESVVPVQRAAPTSGVGAVAGGLLGAVIGNQIGHGSGRAVATIAGGVGGGYLGNHVEQRTSTRTVYSVRVRMDDGRLRTFERSSAVAVGTPVTVEGHNFRLGHGSTYSTAQAPGYRQVSEPPPGTYSTTR